MRHRKSSAISSLSYVSLICLILVGSGKSQSLYALDGKRATGLAATIASVEGEVSYGGDFGFTFLDNRAEMGATLSKTNGKSGGKATQFRLTVWPLRIGSDKAKFFAGFSGGVGITDGSEAIWAAGFGIAGRFWVGRNVHLVPLVTYDHIELFDRPASGDAVSLSFTPLISVSENITLGPGLFISSSGGRTATGASMVFTFMSGVKSKKSPDSERY